MNHVVCIVLLVGLVRYALCCLLYLLLVGLVWYALCCLLYLFGMPFEQNKIVDILHDAESLLFLCFKETGFHI